MYKDSCIMWDQAVAQGLYSRSWWKKDGVNIAKDAKPKAHGWKAEPVRFSYGLFSEDQGVRFRERRIPADDQDAMAQAFPPAG